MKNNINLQIPYGKKALKFSLPADRIMGILKNSKDKNRRNIKHLLKKSLEHALNSKKLEDAIIGKKKILIVVPDATRSSHLKEILPSLLKAIGYKLHLVDIIIATGLHKKHDANQLRSLLGANITNKYNIISHDQDKKELISFGCTKDGIPIILNKRLVQYDFIISIGVIEPHLYAGYSGGAKTVAIGLAGEETIRATHSLRFLDDPGTRIGVIKNNPFQDALWKISDKIKIGFSINIVNDADGKPVNIFSGKTKSVFIKGVNISRHIFAVEVKKPVDVVICGIGYPKDINLYQASRAINYIVNTDNPILKKRGFLIIAAEMRDDVGKSGSETRFYESLKNIRSLPGFIMNMKRNGCAVGEHRAYMVAKSLLDYNVMFVGSSYRKFMKNLPFAYFENIHEALSYADRALGRKTKIYIVPRALSTIARVKP